ncbi:MAG: transposase [Henriciella sp.]|nr:transposase [Henriciella sp.]
MPRLSPEKRAELEAFWWAHHEAWKRSDLNQREYCEVNDLPLKRFGNWRAQFKREPRPEPVHLLYRRGGLSHSFSHRLSPKSDRPADIRSTPNGDPILPPVQEGRRRKFSAADKKAIVRAACRPGAVTSYVARRYGVAPRVLCRWKQELAVADETPRVGTVDGAS